MGEFEKEHENSKAKFEKEGVYSTSAQRPIILAPGPYALLFLRARTHKQGAGGTRGEGTQSLRGRPARIFLPRIIRETRC